MTMVRVAVSGDAEAAVRVVWQSITELCVADHQNDAEALAGWLANKTPENFRSWISNPDSFCVVAEVDGKVSGVGLVDRSGEIKLVYLASGLQRRGMGHVIHAALEKRARAWGLRSLHLDSTVGARPFYESLGYRPAGEAKRRCGVLGCYPYTKALP